MPADLPAWLREEAQKLRERGGPPRGGEAVAIITEYYARVAEEKLAVEVARVRAQVAEEIALAIERTDSAIYAWEAAAIARQHAGKGLPGTLRLYQMLSVPESWTAPFIRCGCTAIGAP